MILCLANLIYVGHEPMATATQFSSAEARASLLSTQNVIASLAGTEGWGRASLGGTRFRQGEAGPPDAGLYASVQASAGVSLSVAPLAGLGFWHDSPTAGPKGRAEGPAPQADERALVAEVAKRCSARGGTPFVAVTNAIGEGRESFETSFRRRIAYALGFHASLRAGSLACYDAWYERTVLGTAAQVDAIARDGDDLDAFSVLANLLSRLNGTAAYEHHHGAPEPRAPGRVLFYREKASLLQARLAAVSRRLGRRFNVDGRIAIRSILSQLRSERKAGTWHVVTSPVWGTGARYDGIFNE